MRTLRFPKDFCCRRSRRWSGSKTGDYDYKENILKNHCRDGNLSVQRRRKQTYSRADRPDSDWKNSYRIWIKIKCTWFQEDFARMEAGEPMTLTLFINNDGREVRREISLKAPDIRSFWKAGLKSQGGMDSQLFSNGRSLCRDRELLHTW